MRQQLAAIGITTPWALLRAVQNFAKTVWDPTRSDIQGGINGLITGALRDAGPARLAEVERERPDLHALFAEGYDPDIDPRRLEAFPDGTLGREYVRFIRANDIDPLATLIEMGPPQNVLQYMFHRAYKLHDLMHVALGCDASILGEVRIVSFSLGQAGSGQGFASRAPGLALVVLLLHLVLRQPEQVRAAVALAGEWLRIGECARPHVTFRLEDHLARPVSEVREMVLAAA